jgi:nucleoside-diphosphate-sugar epimerase
MKKNIIFLGSTGFLGYPILKKIRSKNNIIQINSLPTNKKNIINIKNFKRKIHILEKFKPEIIIDLGWSGIPNYSLENSFTNLKNKIFFYENILKIKTIKKIIITGTCYEYENKNKTCIEHDKVSYNHNLSWAKLSTFNFLEQKCSELKINLIWLRIFYAYGSGQRNVSLIPHIINSIKSNIEPSLRNLDHKNDFIHKDDIANLIKILIRKNIKSGPYNVGTGKSISVRDICNLIYKIFDIKMPSFENSYNKKINFVANITKIVKATNWKPKILLNEKVLKKIIKDGT